MWVEGQGRGLSGGVGFVEETVHAGEEDEEKRESEVKETDIEEGDDLDEREWLIDFNCE